MEPQSKRRWLIRVLIGMTTLVVCALGVTLLRSHGEEDLLGAARQAVEQGDAARSHQDLEGARRAYETADAKLDRLLTRDPNNPRGLVLRYQTLTALYLIVAKQEEDQGQTAGERPSADLLRKAGEYLGRALLDFQNAEAQGIALGNCFSRDDMNLGIAFAERVVRTADQKDIPNYVSYQVGARYVLAWQLLQGVSPQPDDALIHLQESRKLEDPPRWRALGLEAQALKIKADREKRIAGSHPHPAGPDGASRTPSAVSLQRLLGAGIERVQHEMETLPKVTRESPTNLRGLLDFLDLAVTQGADAREVTERAQLLLAVCDQLLVGEKPRESLLSEVAGRAARLPELISRLPANRRPKAEDWATLAPRTEQMALRAVAASTAAAPALCLDLARNARHDGLLAPTERFARKGLEIAAARQMAATDATVLSLHAEIVWVQVCQGKSLEEMDKDLAPLRKNARFVNDAKGQFVEGLLALQDGRLDMAARRFEQVEKEGFYRETVYPWLGLAYVYMALGQPDHAQVYLEKLQEPLRNVAHLPEAARLVAQRLFPLPQSLALELFRCYLGQGQLEKAVLAYKELLPFKAERVTAAIELINYYAAQGFSNWAARRSQTAREMFAAAAEELTTVRPLASDDCRLLWAEVNLQLQRASTEQVPVDEALRQAEERVRAFAAPDGPEGTLCLVRWLIFRNQLAEAEDLLARREKSDVGAHKAQLQLLRAQIGVARGQSAEEADEVEKIAELLEPGDHWLEDPGLVGPRAALSRYEQIALQYYAQAVQAQARGDYPQAARAFERALSYARFRAATRRGLLGSLLTFAGKSPKEAGELADELASRQREEPILLLVAAHAALRMDNLELMQKDLKALEELLTRQKQDGALAPYFAARCWVAAGRSDRARLELVRALKASKDHEPSLRLASQLAKADEDWKSYQRHTTELVKAQPRSLEARQWRAEALTHLGEGAEALKAGQEMVGRYPHQSAGYQVMVGALEQSRDWTGAQSWARRWWASVPDDREALRAVVRVTALAGKDAAGFIESVERQGMKPARPFDVAWAAAQGFCDAGAYAEAEPWAQRALTRSEHKPDALPIELLLGDVYMHLGQREKAIAVYQTVWKDHPGQFAAGMSLARLLNQRPGQSEAAYTILDQLRRGRTSQRPITGDRLPLDYLNVLGVVCRDSRHAKEAVPVFEEAADRYPDEPLIYLHLGRAYAARNRPQDAAQSLEKAARLAEKRAKATRDGNLKARWLALATEARADLQGPR